MAASSPRVRGDICYLPWCRCDGEALWVPPPGLRGSLPPSVGRRQEGQQTRKAQSGLLTGVVDAHAVRTAALTDGCFCHNESVFLATKPTTTRRGAWRAIRAPSLFARPGT